MRILFTPSAEDQFLAAISYVARDKPTAAIALRDRTLEALSRLSHSPLSGRIIPEYPDYPFREVIVRPYRAFYVVKGDTVWIIAFWHSAQSVLEPSEPEDSSGGSDD